MFILISNTIQEKINSLDPIEDKELMESLYESIQFLSSLAEDHYLQKLQDERFLIQLENYLESQQD
jgi:hypothetical protein